MTENRSILHFSVIAEKCTHLANKIDEPSELKSVNILIHPGHCSLWAN